MHIVEYEPDLPVGRALRFVPDASGGSRIVEIPFVFEANLGENLHLDDGLLRGCSPALDFAFPFYGQDYWQP